MARIQSEELGANLVEYGFLAMLIAIAALLAITYVGDGTLSNIEAVNPGFVK